MSRKWFSVIILVVTATSLCSVSSCGFNQHLVSINIPESGGTFGAADPSLFFDFKAYGTYIHPPATKDITNLVTWTSDNPQVVQVSSAGVVSPSTDLGCGVADISASFYDSPNEVVSNSVAVTVDGPASSGCTPAGSQPTLTISFAGNGTGTVSGPAISCSTPSSCSDQFATGTTLALTASPTGSSTFGGWSGCNSTSGSNASVCTILLENSLTVTATFN
jgi:Divergent InlB B-repeat domain